MTDIVERLRSTTVRYGSMPREPEAVAAAGLTDCMEAADEITRLRAALAEAERKVAVIADLTPDMLERHPVRRDVTLDEAEKWGRLQYGRAARAEMRACDLDDKLDAAELRATTAERERDEARAREAVLRETLGFAASVIKSGEPWTKTCETKIGAALDASREGREGA